MNIMYGQPTPRMGTISDRQLAAITAIQNMSIQECRCHKQATAPLAASIPGGKCVPCRARLVLNAITTCVNPQCLHSVFDHYKDANAACAIQGCPGCLSYQ